MLVVAFAVIIPPTPGISRRALAADDDRPLGWTYSPSSFTQRLPIVALAFVGLFVSRYLAAFQLGHIDGLWDPFFGPGDSAQRQRQRGRGDIVGVEGLSRSPMPASAPLPMRSTSWPARSATGAAGAPCRGWCFLFGLLIIPLGVVSVTFIIIQPPLIGALCTLCIMQAAVTVVLIPYSVDEVLATCQYL